MKHFQLLTVVKKLSPVMTEVQALADLRSNRSLVMKTRVSLLNTSLILLFSVGVASCNKEEFYDKEYLDNPYRNDPTTTGSVSGGDQAGSVTGGGTTQGGADSGVTGGTSGSATTGSSTGGSTSGGSADGSTSGGSTSGSVTTGSTSGGSADGSTSSGSTSGSVTTGSTSGGSTSGSVTTGSTTGGSTSGSVTTGSTSGGSTSGSATTGSTSGGSTSGSATTGSTSAGSTSGSVTTGSTSGGSTSGGMTTGSTSGGTTTGTTSGGMTTGSTSGGSSTGGSSTGGSTGATTGGVVDEDCNNGHGNDDDHFDESNPSKNNPFPATSKCKIEYFTQAAEQTKMLDIVWIIDNSGSMADEQTNLGNNFNKFIADFISMNVDFKMGITTTDVSSSSQKGKMVAGSDTKLTSAKAKANKDQFLTDFKNLVQQGIKGSGYEKGLEASEGFMQKNAKSFLRKDAYLAVVILSDEEDQSLKAPSFYTDYLKSYKNSAGLVKIYSIVDKNLKSLGGNTVGFKRYAEASDQTAGVVADITDDYSKVLMDMGKTIIKLLSSFALAHDATPASMKVYVNNQEVFGYTYDASSSSIKFNDGHVPAAGAKIKVLYKKP